MAAAEEKNKPDDADEIRARFAEIEAKTAPPPHHELPPVPVVELERPQTRAASGAGSGPSDGKTSVFGSVAEARSMRGSSMALTIGTTLVAGIGVGAGLGWLVDKFLLHSKETPWGLIVGFLIGVVYGFVNLVQVANRINRDDEAASRAQKK